MIKKLNDLPDVVVIGNSPTALLHEFGELIDSFDKVIRVNKCVTEGYEKFIGTKTSIWSTTTNKRWEGFFPPVISDFRVWLRSRRTFEEMINNRHMPAIAESLGHDIIIDMLFKEIHADKLIIDFFREFSLDDIKSRIVFSGPDHFIKPSDVTNTRSDKDILKYTYRKYWLRSLNYEPCTGLLTILRAISEFKRVAILGFTFSTDDINGGSFEYYRKDEVSDKSQLTSGEHLKNQKNGSSSLEEGTKRMSIIKRLVDEGKIVPLNPEELCGIKIDIVNRTVVKAR